MGTKVVITEGYRWNYFQWFLLGLYELEKQGKINLKFRLPLASHILSFATEKHIVRIADKLRRLFEKDTYNLSGYIDFDSEKEGHKRRRFTIDSADAPYLFNSIKLNDNNIYFKMQCPINLDADQFILADGVAIPWLDHLHVDKKVKKLTQKGQREKCNNFKNNVKKIKPLMVGPRLLSDKSFSYKSLAEGYENYLKAVCNKKTKYIMCYFGNAMGPKPEKDTPSPDFDWEADIMGYFGEQISHPNEKRAIIAKYLSRINGCDARVINEGNSDSGVVEHSELVVPLDRFCDFISDFQYNFNVSGYRMSIPNRFIESFMVGTGIITDKLSVKWYKNFDDEVYETVSMGYLPINMVEWEKLEKDLNNLPDIKPDRVIEAFEKKWSPKVVAQYIIDTVKES